MQTSHFMCGEFQGSGPSARSDLVKAVIRMITQQVGRLTEGTRTRPYQPDLALGPVPLRSAYQPDLALGPVPLRSPLD